MKTSQPALQKPDTGTNIISQIHQEIINGLDWVSHTALCYRAFSGSLDSFASLVVAFLVSKSHKVNYEVLGYFKMLTG